MRDEKRVRGGGGVVGCQASLSSGVWGRQTDRRPDRRKEERTDRRIARNKGREEEQAHGKCMDVSVCVCAVPVPCVPVRVVPPRPPLRLSVRASAAAVQCDAACVGVRWQQHDAAQRFNDSNEAPHACERQYWR
jgi:hypothetical protein